MISASVWIFFNAGFGSVLEWESGIADFQTSAKKTRVGYSLDDFVGGDVNVSIPKISESTGGVS